MISEAKIIEQTRKWIQQVVIGMNFCPFAAKPFKDERIEYIVVSRANHNTALQTLMQECYRLEEENETETSFIIFPDSFLDFEEYLDLVDLTETLIKNEGFDGVYQVASFHPDYIFSGTNHKDAANYTNRSPYPMLHILREESLEEAIKKHPDTGKIPEKNVILAREKGLEFMKNLFKNVREDD